MIFTKKKNDIVSFYFYTMEVKMRLEEKHPYYTEADLLNNESYFEQLVKDNKTFSFNTHNVLRVATQMEKIIERMGFRCRVYTENRAAAMGATLIPTGITQAVGIASAVGIAAHNLATFNPDYEIGKNITANQVNVTYKK